MEGMDTDHNTTFKRMQYVSSSVDLNFLGEMSKLLVQNSTLPER